VPPQIILKPEQKEKIICVNNSKGDDNKNDVLDSKSVVLSDDNL
jgi:hypothetical protein